MPHANIWIRKSDWEKWQQLKDKSAFIHSALAGEEVSQASAGDIFSGKTCRYGHPSADGKHCLSIKCAYFKS